MKVMIAAGGTGGHIHPALALADKIKAHSPENEVIFFGSLNRMEADVIPAHGYRFYGARMSVTNGGFVQKTKAAASMISAYGTCAKIMKKEKPDICIGFGNYISVPLIT
ncbi:MAG: glycosyltransferase, partial [Solobacterium sp.]|nr:glycosyltransferase [Solobacterium sp.]